MTTLDLDSLNPCGAEWDLFRASCKAPVYSERWNSWMLLYSTKDPQKVTATQIASQVKELFGRDVGGRLFGGTFVEGITNLEVIPFLAKKVSPDGSFADFLAAHKAQVAVAEKYQGSSSPILSADLARQESPCAISGAGPYWTLVMVNFIHRGGLGEVPWLTAKRFDLFIPYPLGTNAIDSVSYMCPVKPTFLLTEVMAPQDREPEPEDSIVSELGNGIERVGEGLGKIVDKGGMAFLEGAAPYILLGLGAYLVLKP